MTMQLIKAFSFSRFSRTAKIVFVASLVLGGILFLCSASFPNEKLRLDIGGACLFLQAVLVWFLSGIVGWIHLRQKANTESERSQPTAEDYNQQSH